MYVYQIKHNTGENILHFEFSLTIFCMSSFETTSDSRKKRSIVVSIGTTVGLTTHT